MILKKTLVDLYPIQYSVNQFKVKEMKKQNKKRVITNKTNEK